MNSSLKDKICNKMKWYRFWKKVHGYNCGEDYQEFPKDYIEEQIKSECERWAEKIPGGHNSYYTYGFESIKLPPKEWLNKQIKNHKERKKYNKSMIKHYQKILDGL